MPDARKMHNVQIDGNLTANGPVSLNTPITISGEAEGVEATDAANIDINCASAAAGAYSRIRLLRSRGTIATPANTSDGDMLGSIRAFGYANTGYQNCARISFLQDGASAARVPGKIALLTGTNAAGPAAALTLNADKSAVFTGTVTAGGSFLNIPVKATTGDPTGAVAGSMYINTFDKKIRCYNGTGWVDLGTWA